MHLPLRLPPLQPTTDRKQPRIHRPPRHQNPKIQPNPRMQIEQYLPAPFHNRMQRPRVSPAVKCRRDFNIVEGCGHVGDYPEDEEEAHPGLADDHGHVFAGEAECDHAEEVEHPVDEEGAVAVRDGVALGGVSQEESMGRLATYRIPSW
jgi:hypothetical protein